MLAYVEEGACLSILRMYEVVTVNIKLRESYRIYWLMLILNSQDPETFHEVVSVGLMECQWMTLFCLWAILNILNLLDFRLNLLHIILKLLTCQLCVCFKTQQDTRSINRSLSSFGNEVTEVFGYLSCSSSRRRKRYVSVSPLSFLK